MSYSDGLVIGAMKAGTTTLSEDLTEIVGVELLPKEGGRFLRSKPVSPHSVGGALHLEICSEYAMAHRHPQVAARVAGDLGTEIPIIYILRNPIDRLVSHLRHLSSLGTDKVNLEAQMRAGSHAVMTSSYGFQLGYWLDAGFTNLTLVDFHSYMADREQGISAVLKALSVEPPDGLRLIRRHANSSDQLRSARRLIRPVVRSQAYRAIRPAIPNNLIAALKRTPFAQPAMDPPLIDAERLAALEAAFASDWGELRATELELPTWLSGEIPRKNLDDSTGTFCAPEGHGPRSSRTSWNESSQ